MYYWEKGSTSSVRSLSIISLASVIASELGANTENTPFSSGVNCTPT